MLSELIACDPTIFNSPIQSDPYYPFVFMQCQMFSLVK